MSPSDARLVLNWCRDSPWKFHSREKKEKKENKKTKKDSSLEALHSARGSTSRIPCFFDWLENQGRFLFKHPRPYRECSFSQLVLFWVSFSCFLQPFWFSSYLFLPSLKMEHSFQTQWPQVFIVYILFPSFAFETDGTVAWALLNST